LRSHDQDSLPAYAAITSSRPRNPEQRDRTIAA
jgi:hypothetical protein